MLSEGTLRKFPRNDIFYGFFRNFYKKNLDLKRFKHFEDLHPVVGNAEGALGVAIWPLNMTAQNLEVFEMTILCDFFKKKKFKKTNLVFFFKV